MLDANGRVIGIGICFGGPFVLRFAGEGRLAGVVTIAAVVVVLDQITKLIALSRLTLGVPVIVVDGFAALTLVMNPGLAFGLLGGIPASWRWVVTRPAARRRSPSSSVSWSGFATRRPRRARRSRS